MEMMGSRPMQGYVAHSNTSHRPSTTLDLLEQPQPHRSTPHLIVRMANRGYDVVVDVDQEVRNAGPGLQAQFINICAG